MNLFNDLSQARVIQTAGNKLLLVEAVPVDGGEAYDVIFGIKDLIATSVQRRADLPLRHRHEWNGQKKKQ